MLAIRRCDALPGRDPKDASRGSNKKKADKGKGEEERRKYLHMSSHGLHVLRKFSSMYALRISFNGAASIG